MFEGLGGFGGAGEGVMPGDLDRGGPGDACDGGQVRAGRRVDDVIAQTVGDPTQADCVVAMLAELLLASPVRAEDHPRS